MPMLHATLLVPTVIGVIGVLILRLINDESTSNHTRFVNQKTNETKGPSPSGELTEWDKVFFGVWVILLVGCVVYTWQTGLRGLINAQGIVAGAESRRVVHTNASLKFVQSKKISVMVSAPEIVYIDNPDRTLSSSRTTTTRSLFEVVRTAKLSCNVHATGHLQLLSGIPKAALHVNALHEFHKVVKLNDTQDIVGRSEKATLVAGQQSIELGTMLNADFTAEMVVASIGADTTWPIVALFTPAQDDRDGSTINSVSTNSVTTDPSSHSNQTAQDQRKPSNTSVTNNTVAAPNKDESSKSINANDENNDDENSNDGKHIYPIIVAITFTPTNTNPTTTDLTSAASITRSVWKSTNTSYKLQVTEVLVITSARTLQLKQLYASSVDHDTAESRCCICYDTGTTVALLPCGHKCVCPNCLVHIDKTCPMCRTNVVSVLQEVA